MESTTCNERRQLLKQNVSVIGILLMGSKPSVASKEEEDHVIKKTCDRKEESDAIRHKSELRRLSNPKDENITENQVHRSNPKGENTTEDKSRRRASQTKDVQPGQEIEEDRSIDDGETSRETRDQYPGQKRYSISGRLLPPTQPPDNHKRERRVSQDENKSQAEPFSFWTKDNF